MKRVLIIDNYDSFTFNLVQQMGALNCEIFVHRNDAPLSTVLKEDPTHLVISPGPGNPSHAGISRDVVEHFRGRIPVLGVCLGLQLIGEMYGARVVRAPQPVHGQTAAIFHNGEGVFSSIASPTNMARYHSLILDRNSFPSDLEMTAWTEEGLVMGIRHKHIANLEAVQFHPESFMSLEGETLMRNFLNDAR